jgi:putative flippase GtrA
MENAFTRWMKFNAVGASGLVVHLGLLALFVRVCGLHYLVASAVSIEAAILHKFFWHCRWTWADRCSDGGFAARSRTFLRFNASTGFVAIFANLVSVYLLTGLWEIDPILANAISMGPGGLANFLLCNRLVFTPHFAPRARRPGDET